MRIVAVVQARLGSTRLPRKVLARIEGKPMLQRVYERAQLIEGIDDVRIAIPRDEPALTMFCREILDTEPILGSPDDVLTRYYVAAKETDADAVCRVTGDCPLLDPSVSSEVVKVYRAGGFDYVSNTHPGIDGLDTEVFSVATLDAAWEATRRFTEHVTAWMQATQTPLAKGHVCLEAPGVKWSVDTVDDLERVRAIYRHVGRDVFGYAEALDAERCITDKG